MECIRIIDSCLLIMVSLLCRRGSLYLSRPGRARPNSVDTKDIGEFLRLMPVQIYVNIAMAVSKLSI